ncbi:MAG: 6-phosphogluconolactonase [Marmoricola sp.]
MTATVIRQATTSALATDVATRLLELLGTLQQQGRLPQIVLTGGGFAQQLHQELARLADGYPVDWQRVDFWWGDERFVLPESPDRNAREARQSFLDVVGATRIHEMPTPNSACSVDEGARAYEAQIRASDAGRFDLVMLSLGPDGHVASLFPGSPQLETRDRIAVGVTGSPKPPPERITLTLEALNRSARVWLFAADSGPGGAKEDAFNRVQADDPALPATHLRGQDETIWFVS